MSLAYRFRSWHTNSMILKLSVMGFPTTIKGTTSERHLQTPVQLISIHAFLERQSLVGNSTVFVAMLHVTRDKSQRPLSRSSARQNALSNSHGSISKRAFPSPSLIAKCGNQTASFQGYIRFFQAGFVARGGSIRSITLLRHGDRIQGYVSQTCLSLLPPTLRLRSDTRYQIKI
ncbi:hypothetical protein AUEXF2481DRAFT_640253 [Aureobasidium subglaciale EXF-2481]|uniref:Uncharacterized protein n=1 Tax=Aureobasidium subglaciale (strain EXF-2481) TaxID=1043005 RepID=A0A074YF79_AURSE|nr:uncharacterized protein AUEXF2481DRAFT_640253 [Aureobasidium subglaciale EXF-2481]KEQ96473.1 hypothetical protein AUEXF2481DRAFT_640253 [Aureobasidium subglaciale EXF-2481]